MTCWCQTVATACSESSNLDNYLSSVTYTHLPEIQLPLLHLSPTSEMMPHQEFGTNVNEISYFSIPQQKAENKGG